ncbi:MAG: nitronate monooxygenase [Lachnospiraceae bacterium]|nr:nitronate monooxygenase [Lachnospiraceae bacterium]
MKTKITELLGIEYPIIQGGMAWVAEYHLAAAVSEAGGLGIIGAGGAPASFVREQIQKTKEITKKPFGVNVMLMNPEADEIAKVIVEEGVPVVTTGAGNPGKYLAAWKEAGIRVMPVVASVALAKMMERAGVDAVIAEGTESGGHIGSATTMTLVPQVVDAVNIPVIAAGGIGDGRGFAAALMLGAEAVQMGTRFVVAKESIEPVMPGVLIIEALAQTGAVAILSQPGFKGKTAYFAAINHAKFKGKVLPGDVLTLETEILKIKGSIGVGAAKAYVDGKLVTQAELTFFGR